MSEKINKASFKENSIHYIYLPEPQDKRSMYYFTSAGHEYLLPDYYMSRKNNDLFMINFVVNGALSLTVDGKTQVMRRGDLCFLNLVKPNILFPIDEDTEIYFFHFHGENIKNIYNSYISHGDNVISNVSLEEIENLFNDLGRSVENGNDLFYNSGLLYSFLMKLLSVRDQSRSAYPPIVFGVIKYLWGAFPTPSPKEIADHFGYNHIYLERKFKQYVGESLGKYIQRKKYGQACQYLMDGDMSVAEIALTVGYKTPQGLITLFKKMGNTTPLAFKNSLKK